MTLRFANLTEDQLADNMAAAMKLKLPFEAAGRGLTVMVEDVMDAWMLGVESTKQRENRERRNAQRDRPRPPVAKRMAKRQILRRVAPKRQ